MTASQTPSETPSLRLFLSADLMGSTALKSEGGGADLNPPWLDTFQDFYQEFPAVFSGEQKNHGCPQIEFWKGIGDELLWFTSLPNGDAAIATLRAFKGAIEKYNSLLDATDKKVRLKGTAWLAGFPITHKEVKLPSGNFDYIGPYIDTGFRLSKFSSRMRMVVSVDLAWMILNCRTCLHEDKDLPLRFDSSESMKGVLGGRPYPIIWIQCTSPLEELEYKLCRTGDGKDWKEELEKFCSAFINDTDEKIIFPYIIDDAIFGKPHKSYQAWLEKLKTPARPPLETENGDDAAVEKKSQSAVGGLNKKVLLANGNVVDEEHKPEAG